MHTVTGIHHITCISGDAQENVDFYSGVMGMRLVKRSVNQDAPDTYHLFYADAEGHPGTDLTFFPWPGMPPARAGVGLTMEVQLAVPVMSLGYWAERLTHYGVRPGEPVTRFGERTLTATDPHGLPIALVETDAREDFAPWPASPVPEGQQIRGLHGVRLWERSVAATAQLLTGTLGFAALGEEGGWHRFSVAGGGSGRVLDIAEMPNAGRGQWGVGGVHHVAWRTPNEDTQVALREQVHQAGRRPTPVIDRFWFQSVYFTEPGGVLFEIATDGPGFAIDEEPGALGERLILPPWLEPQRAEIERGLPPLRTPTLAAREK
ncbi:MAG: ring-cleaving dioxygenase [Gemmatimonadaceae bacterium]